MDWWWYIIYMNKMVIRRLINQYVKSHEKTRVGRLRRVNGDERSLGTADIND